MKLRNKKTGDIGELSVWYRADNKEIKEFGVIKENEKFPTDYKSLAELNEDWEDYEETKDWWSIDQFGEPINVTGLNSLQLEKLRRIGNLFRSEEETEKAVEKLKTWKRLKDRGFKIDLWDYDGGNYQERIRTGKILFRVKDYEEENDKDLAILLFGSEE